LFILWFPGHTLPTTNTKTPINGSKDTFSPSFFLRKKASSCGWGPGPDEMGQKGINLPSLWRQPRSTSNPKFPNFFIESKIEKSFCTFRGFEQLSISICWRVMAEYVGNILRQTFGARETWRVNTISCYKRWRLDLIWAVKWRTSGLTSIS